MISDRLASTPRGLSAERDDVASPRDKWTAGEADVSAFNYC